MFILRIISFQMGHLSLREILAKETRGPLSRGEAENKLRRNPNSLLAGTAHFPRLASHTQIRLPPVGV